MTKKTAGNTDQLCALSMKLVNKLLWLSHIVTVVRGMELVARERKWERKGTCLESSSYVLHLLRGNTLC